MKNFKLFIPLVTLLAVFMLSFEMPGDGNKNVSSSAQGFVVPDNVQKVIDQSCFACHNMDAKNDKAKSALLFDALDTLKVAKLVGKLADIRDEVKDDKMPPAKFLQFNPEVKLSVAQKDLLINWADSTAKSYIK